MAEQHKVEDLKGRAKEAVGTLTHNKKLQRKGKVTRLSAFVKRTGEQAKQKVTELAKDTGLAKKLKRSM